jgi:hypothetical protein
MKLGGRRAGSSTLFIDTATDEVVLRIITDESGCPLVAFKLYDSSGCLVSDQPEPRSFPEGLCVESPDHELLLQLPADQQGAICYKLYSKLGTLLTLSNGERTQVYSNLRMDGKSMNGRTKDV